MTKKALRNHPKPTSLLLNHQPPSSQVPPRGTLTLPTEQRGAGKRFNLLLHLLEVLQEARVVALLLQADALGLLAPPQRVLLLHPLDLLLLLPLQVLQLCVIKLLLCLPGERERGNGSASASSPLGRLANV